MNASMKSFPSSHSFFCCPIIRFSFLQCDQMLDNKVAQFFQKVAPQKSDHICFYSKSCDFKISPKSYPIFELLLRMTIWCQGISKIDQSGHTGSLPPTKEIIFNPQRRWIKKHLDSFKVKRKKVVSRKLPLSSVCLKPPFPCRRAVVVVASKRSVCSPSTLTTPVWILLKSTVFVL